MSMVLLVLPILLTATVISFVMAVIQTVTSIQDQTTPQTLKLIAIALVVIMASTWMFSKMTGLARSTVTTKFEKVLDNRHTIGTSESFNSTFKDQNSPLKEISKLKKQAENIQVQNKDSMLQTFSLPLSKKHKSSEYGESANSLDLKARMPVNTFKQGFSVKKKREMEEFNPTLQATMPNYSVRLDKNSDLDFEALNTRPRPNVPYIRPILPGGVAENGLNFSMGIEEGDALPAPVNSEGQGFF